MKQSSFIILNKSFIRFIIQKVINNFTTVQEFRTKKIGMITEMR